MTRLTLHGQRIVAAEVAPHEVDVNLKIVHVAARDGECIIVNVQPDGEPRSENLCPNGQNSSSTW